MQKRIFPDRLREMMAESGAKQAEVADAAGVTQSTVSRWLEGQSTPKAEDLYALALHYGISMDWFFGASRRSPADTVQGSVSIDALQALADDARAGASAMRVGAERFGRLQEMMPRIQALEKEAGALRKIIEEMVESGYTPAAEESSSSVAPHILEAADHEMGNAERSIRRRRKAGDKGRSG